ncbi:MAG TPA: winged helix-turn-helix transcriptional regulator [Dehalococcoidia bacterium]|nr:winged helix-turn-helix transcriptional regulator [Dehalococcoidia bacterium]
MHSTKNEILALLKRSDGSTVDELASAVGLAPMTVRQHLMALERDGLVASEEVRRPSGRPHHCYRLTDGGHRRVSDGHDRLLTLLVQHVGALAPQDVTGDPDLRRARLFQRAASALAAEHEPALRALPWPDRIERVASVLRSYGGFVDWHDLGDGAYELRDFSCVFRATVGTCMPCAWHEAFLTGALGAAVQPLDEPADCADCCRFTVTVPALAGAAAHSRSSR